MLTLYERSLGYSFESPAPLEELVETMERYCRDWDSSEASTLFSSFENDTSSMYRGRLQKLGGELNREFGPAEPVMSAGQVGLTRDLLLRSLAVHIRAWDRHGTFPKVVTEDCEPGRKLEWETRKSGCVGSELERMGTIARPVRRDDEESANVTLASLIAETAFACCGLEWDGSHNVNPLPPEDTAALRQFLKKAWVGARQLTSWKLSERLWELERTNAPLLRALMLRDDSLRDALADLHGPMEARSTSSPMLVGSMNLRRTAAWSSATPPIRGRQASRARTRRSRHGAFPPCALQARVRTRRTAFRRRTEPRPA